MTMETMEPEDDGPTIEEAKAADVPFVPDPANADLPTDVRDGEIKEDGQE